MTVFSFLRRSGREEDSKKREKENTIIILILQKIEIKEITIGQDFNENA